MRGIFLFCLLAFCMGLSAQITGSISWNLVNDSEQYSMGEVTVSVIECPSWITITTDTEVTIPELAAGATETATFHYYCPQTSMTMTGNVVLQAVAETGDILTGEFALTFTQNTDNKIIVALDRSYSMLDEGYTHPAGFTSWNTSRLSLMNFVNMVNYGDDFAMIDFALQPTEVISRRNFMNIADKNAVIDELSLSGGLGINSPTSYYQNVGEVYSYTCFGNMFDTAYDTGHGYTDVYSLIANEFSDADDVNVIVITDGLEQNPVNYGYNPSNYNSIFHPLSEVLASTLRAHNIHLYPIVIEGYTPADPDSYDNAHAYFSYLAQETGGEYFHVGRSGNTANVDEALIAVYHDIVADQQLMDWKKHVTLNSSADDELEITVDPAVGQLKVEFCWSWGEGTSGYDHTLSLVNPNGQEITVSDPDNGIYYNQGFSGVGSGISNFIVDTPDPGTWQAIITRDPGMTSTWPDDFAVYASAQSTLLLYTSLDPSGVKIGDSPTLEVYVADGNSYIDNAEVSVIIEHQPFTGSIWDYPETVTLTNNGYGSYSTELSCFTEQGYYHLEITAQNAEGYPAFVRNKEIFINVQGEYLFPPANLIITTNTAASTCTLSWSSVYGATRYYVYSSSITSGEFTNLTPTGITTTQFTTSVSGLDKRFFKVVAYKP